MFWFKKDTTEEDTKTLFKHLKIISDDNCNEIDNLIRKLYEKHIATVGYVYSCVYDEFGNTALHHICAACKSPDSSNSCRELIFLAANSIDINDRNYNGETAFHIICKSIANIYPTIEESTKETCIEMACILLRGGADMYTPDNNGNFPIDITKYNKQLKKLLINFDKIQKNIYS